MVEFKSKQWQWFELYWGRTQSHRNGREPGYCRHSDVWELHREVRTSCLSWRNGLSVCLYCRYKRHFERSIIWISHDYRVSCLGWSCGVWMLQICDGTNELEDYQVPSAINNWEPKLYQVLQGQQRHPGEPGCWRRTLLVMVVSISLVSNLWVYSWSCFRL